DSVPNVVRRVNNAFVREDEKQTAVGEPHVNGFAPIIADGEAGFGGPLNALELMKAMIEAGAAAVHFEDQLASAKKCGHLGGKVLVSTGVFLQKLVAARLAADLCDVPTILIARTDANSAKLITTDVDPRDQPFIVDAERTTEGFHRFRGGIDASIARGVAYAPYADLLWCETSGPDLDEARTFADGVHARFPGKMLAYNCSSSFNWRKKLERKTIAAFQEELADMGYCFQFVTLAGFHALNLSMSQQSEGQLAQADREWEQRLLLPKELRGLQDRVQIADRVLLFADRPLTVEVHYRGQDVVERDIRLESVAHRLFGGRGLVSQARFEGGDEGRSVGRLRWSDPKKFRIAEFRRQRAIQLPQEPGVLRRREVAAGKTRGVRLTQRVSQEPGFSARGDEERTIRCVGFSFERERPEDLLDAIELPVLEETTQQLDIRL